ncbi:MAG: hypothetical protein IJY67_09680, partial [Paludibacteraceae bacterium]|nr:hypothetical protein [Paludibacteraceae bacterium]
MKKIFLLGLFFLFTIHILRAESYWNYEPYSTEGREFYVTFMMNAGGHGNDNVLQFYLYASTRSDKANIVVENPTTGYKKEFNCTKNEVGKIEIPNIHGYLDTENEVLPRGLKVTSDVPISLYASNHNHESYDATNVLPIEALSTEYIIQTYSFDRQATEFALVATADNTQIIVTPSDYVKIEDTSSINPILITLNKGEAYQIRGFKPENDLSGTIVCANQPIAVFNGGQSAIVPEYAGTDDHLVEQSLPTYMWGKEFIVTNSKVQDFNIVKITAMYDNTKIYINHNQDTVLNKAESYEFALYKSTIDSTDIEIAEDTTMTYIIDDALYINSSYPTLCFSYHTSQDASVDMDKEYRRLSDPSMIFIPPLEQSINEISFLTYNINNTKTHHFVNIVTKTDNIYSVVLDNKNISSDFSVVSCNANYSYARIKIEQGSHKITSKGDGFLAYVYGIGNYESYGYNVGNNLLPMGAYMLIDGERVNEKYFCFSDVIPFEAIINYDYSNIEWDMGDGHKFYGLKNISHHYTDTGTYEITLVVTKESILCSSVDSCVDCANISDTIKAKVHILDEHIIPLEKEICYGDSYVWHVGDRDTILKTPGLYVDTLKNIYGCDSIINLNLIVHPIPRDTFSLEICKSETPYNFNDNNLQNLITTGIYIDTLTSQFGCDSIVTLNLIVHPTYLFERDTIICENEVLSWRGQTHGNLLVGDTTYWDRLTTKYTSCDSVYKLNVHVQPTYEFVHVDTICDNMLPYQWRGKNYTTTGVYYDSLTSQYGCDSV